MRLKSRKKTLLVVAFAICICFLADWATPYSVDQPFDFDSASGRQRVVQDPHASLKTSAAMALLDLNTGEFTTPRSARLAGWRGSRPQLERGNSDLLVLIGFGCMLFGSAVMIRRRGTG